MNRDIFEDLFVLEMTNNHMGKFDRDINLAINHCVAAYPHEDQECELNQIDFLRNRYPGHTIGWSSHECHDWNSSVLIAYAYNDQLKALIYQRGL